VTGSSAQQRRTSIHTLCQRLWVQSSTLSSWPSIDRPTASLIRLVVDVSTIRLRPVGHRLSRLRGFRVPGSPDSVVRVAIRGRVTRRCVQRYLAAYSYCPVYARWRDLGRRFWPRWIREGSCRGELRSRSCSIPAGMTCRPKRSATKTVLWWYCRVSQGRAGQSAALAPSAWNWIPIKYPIITACKCSC